MRARTLRVVARFVAVLALRETTLRVVVERADVAVFAVVELARDTTLRVAVPREVVVVFVAIVGRADEAVFDVPRGLARPERGDWACVIAVDASIVGAIGSANTTRIDNNVEHTKNAPISNNTVPSAFLHIFAT